MIAALVLLFQNFRSYKSIWVPSVDCPPVMMTRRFDESRAVPWLLRDLEPAGAMFSSPQ